MANPQSRDEEILQSIVDDTPYTRAPQSRNEEILKSIVDGTPYTKVPQSREESLLLEVKDLIEQGGGGGGDYTIQQVVEALETNSDISSNANTPVATMYKTDETYSRYIRTTSNSVTLALKGYSFNDKATKVNCGLYMTGGSFPIRKSDSGIFPVASDSFGDMNIRKGEKIKLKINPDKIGTRHPAIVKKYPTIFNNQWIDYSDDEFNLTDLATLTNATTDDYIVVYNSGSTYYIYRYVGESAPVFEISSGSNYRAMNSQKDFRHDIYSALVASAGRKLNDVVAISGSERTDSFPIASIIAATFDIKDANDMVLFAKNADITDYVLPTT